MSVRPLLLLAALRRIAGLWAKARVSLSLTEYWKGLPAKGWRLREIRTLLSVTMDSPRHPECRGTATAFRSHSVSAPYVIDYVTPCAYCG